MAKHLKQQQQQEHKHKRHVRGDDDADPRPYAPPSKPTSSSSQGKPKSFSGGVSLTSFAQRKGQIRALEEFKKRKEHKRLETAKTLRRYQKVMKQEGMEAGRGASRKRTLKEEEEDNNNEEDTSKNDNEEQDLQKDKNRDVRNTPISQEDRSSNSNHHHHKNKKQRTNPLTKSVIKAQQAKQYAALQVHQREEHEKERQRKLRQRKQQSKLLQKRTKRGQPIMGNMINNLLRKLEKQKTTTEKEL